MRHSLVKGQGYWWTSRGGRAAFVVLGEGAAGLQLPPGWGCHEPQEASERLPLIVGPYGAPMERHWGRACPERDGGGLQNFAKAVHFWGCLGGPVGGLETLCGSCGAHGCYLESLLLLACKARGLWCCCSGGWGSAGPVVAKCEAGFG